MASLRLSRPARCSFRGTAPAFAAAGALLAASQASAVNFAFSTGNPDGKIATASRLPSGTLIEIESADDFVLPFTTAITSATVTGLVPAGASNDEFAVELYRIFPADSTNPPSGHVPTRVNSPADNAFESRDSAKGEITFTSTVLNPNFTALNSVLNGINPVPNQTTGGEGPITGQEVQFTLHFNPPFALAAGH